MDVKELLNKSASTIRNSNELMQLFISYYKEYFAAEPNCYGCNWQKVYNDFKNKVINQNRNVMKDLKKDFKFKKSVPDIIGYKEGKATVWIYAKDATNEYVIKFLTLGTPEQIEQRKTYFEVLPNFEIEQEATEQVDAVEAEKPTEVVKENKPKRTKKK